MTPERWVQVKALFDDALQREPAERARWLDQAAGHDPTLATEVRSLLASHERAGAFLSTPAPLPETLGGPGPEPAPSLAGRRLGPYRLLGEIGHGGMGAVYRAVRDDDQYQKQVAIKLIRGGWDSSYLRDRFKAERQILANLEHPSIARLIDGGTTEEGWPYLAMEYVQGEPIDTYCEARALGTRERLRLLVSVCAAVAYAHRRLVVHRDLKPANILVTADGLPKLLDFGIAKLLDPDAAAPVPSTLTGWGLMTPAYASPEQVRGEAITTASDVYSLGVLAYKLLSGVAPYQIQGHAPQEILRAVCDTEPVRPSIAARRHRDLRGDLDTIVLKALHKDPGRRYASVEALAEDLGRHLDGLPVRARGDSPAYRLGKLARRHRVAVIGAALLLLSLVGGIVATTREARRARASQARAERRFADVRALANSLLFELHDAIETLPGSTRARELLVTRALAYLDSLAQEAGDDRSLRRELATAYQRVGEVQFRSNGPNLGDSTGALASHRKALALREALLAEAPADEALLRELGLSHSRIGELVQRTGDSAAALASHRRALETWEKLAPSSPERAACELDRALTFARIGQILQGRGQMSAAAEELQRGLAVARARLQAEPGSLPARRAVAGLLSELGFTLGALEQHDEALASLREADQLAAGILAADPANTKSAHDAWVAAVFLGIGLSRGGDLAAAEATFRKALDLARERVTADPASALAPNDLAISYANLADVQRSAHRRAEALQNYLRSAALFEGLRSRDPSDLGVLGALAECLEAMGPLQEEAGDGRGAVESLRQAVSHRQTLQQKDPANREAVAALASARSALASLCTHRRASAPCPTAVLALAKKD